MFVSLPRYDVTDALWSTSSPLTGATASDVAAATAMLSTVCKAVQCPPHPAPSTASSSSSKSVAMVMEAVYSSQDGEWQDVQLLQRMLHEVGGG